jgi:hypothetical protein
MVLDDDTIASLPESAARATPIPLQAKLAAGNDDSGHGLQRFQTYFVIAERRSDPVNSWGWHYFRERRLCQVMKSSRLPNRRNHGFCGFHGLLRIIRIDP